jgi:hypothetical protein
MKAQVRSMSSPDTDLVRFTPEDPENFSFLLEVVVGPSDDEGAELLQLVVCTLRNLEERLVREDVILVDHW